MQKIGQYVRMQDSEAVVEVEGAYGLCNTVAVKTELNAALQKGCTKVELDLSRTDSVDSSVVHDISRMEQKVGAGNIRIINASGKVRAFLRDSAIGHLLAK